MCSVAATFFLNIFPKIMGNAHRDEEELGADAAAAATMY